MNNDPLLTAIINQAVLRAPKGAPDPGPEIEAHDRAEKVTAAVLVALAAAGLEIIDTIALERGEPLREVGHV